MKWLKFIILILFAFTLTFLDASFFSFFSFLGTNILISFVFLITFAFLLKYREFIIFIFATSIFFAVFSSISVWQIFVCFFILPELTFFIKRKYLPEIFVLPSMILFMVTSIAFGGILILGNGDFSAASVSELGYFVLSNSILGILVFAIVKKISDRYRRNEIRITG